MKYLKTAVLATMVLSGTAMANLTDGFDSVVLEGNISGEFGNESNPNFELKLEGQKNLGDNVRLTTSVGGNNDGALAYVGVSHTSVTDRGDIITLSLGADLNNGATSFIPAIEFIEAGSKFGLSYSPLGLGFVEIKDGHKYRYSLDPISNMFQILTGQRTILHALSDHLGLKPIEVKEQILAVNINKGNVIVAMKDGTLWNMHNGTNFWTLMDVSSMSDAELEMYYDE